MTASFDDHERAQWRGAAEVYHGRFAPLCAHPAPALRDAAEVGAGCRVLDAGTGTGTVAALAAARGADVVAVDAEPSMVELARRRVPAAVIRLAALPHLPLADDSADAAVANFVLNHVGDPAAAVAELRRAVRPGGVVERTSRRPGHPRAADAASGPGHDPPRPARVRPAHRAAPGPGRPPGAAHRPARLRHRGVNGDPAAEVRAGWGRARVDG